MNYLYLFVIMLVTAVPCKSIFEKSFVNNYEVTGTPDSYGSEFVLGILPTVDAEKTKVDLILTNQEEQETEVWVHSPIGVVNVTVPPLDSKVTVIFFPPNSSQIIVSSPSTEERSKGIKVVACCGKKIGVTVTVHEFYGLFVGGAYQVFPTWDYGIDTYEYWVPVDVVTNTILLVAAHNETIIKLNASFAVEIPADLSPIGSTTKLSHVEFTLHHCQTFLIQDANRNSSKINILTNKPIALFYGNPNLSLSSNTNRSDFIGEQLPPTITWGQNFIFGSFSANDALLGLIAAQDLTQVDFACTKGEQASVKVNNGDTRYFGIISEQNACTVSASGPVFISILSIGSIMILPPTEQYVKTVKFPSVASFFSYPNYLEVVVMATADGFNSSKLLVGEQFLQDSKWTAVQLANGTILGYITYQQLNDEVKSVRSLDPEIGISAAIYYFQTFSFIAGMGLSPINGLDVVLSTPPANLSGVVLGSTSLLLSWSHPQESGYIQGYSVTYNNTHDSAMYLQVEGTTLTLKDLQKFTNYSIQVAAFNSGGCGPSATIYLMTDSDIPSAPVGVTYVNQSSTSVLISWSPPEIFDGIISTYILSYTRVETNITYFCSTDNSTQYHLDGLEKYELYTVSVTAKTGKGVGVPSEPLVILTDQDVPGLPQNVNAEEVNSTAFIVSWSKPPEPNGVIIQYQLIYTSSEETVNITYPVMQLSIDEAGYYSVTVSGLSLVEGKFEIKLRAATSIGPGNFSSTVAIETVDKFEPELQGTTGKSIMRKEGEAVTFNCTADGAPAPTILWTRNDQLLVVNPLINKFENKELKNNGTSAALGVIRTSSVLTVYNLGSWDDGTYSCKADNGVGEAATLDIPYVLTVAKSEISNPCYGQPCRNGGMCVGIETLYLCKCADHYTGVHCEESVVIEIPPEIVDPPVDTIGRLYTSVTLHCVATGNPQPSIKWHKDGQPQTITAIDPPTIVINELGLSDRGFYQCEAESVLSGKRVSMLSKTVVLNIEGIMQYATEIEIRDNFFTRHEAEIHPSSLMEDVEDLLSKINQLLVGNPLIGNSFIFFVETQHYYTPSTTIPVIITIITEEGPSEELEQALQTELNKLKENLLMTVNISDINRFDGCQSSNSSVSSQSGDPNLSIVITWPETDIGQTVYVGCPCGELSISTEQELLASRYCGGDFTNGAEWQEADIAACNFSDLARTICSLANLDTKDMVESLQSLTEDPGSLGDEEVIASVAVLKTAIDSTLGDLPLTENFLSIVDNILHVDRIVLQQTQSSAKTSSWLLDAIEQVSSNIPFCQNKSSFVISRELFAVSVEQVDPMEFTGNMLLVSLSGELFLEDNGNTSWNELLLMRDNTHSASVSLPIGLFNTLDVYNVTRVTHSVFLTDSLFAMRKESYQEVGSVIVSATVVNRSVEGLDPPITLTFLRNLNGTNPTCSFWDPSLDGGYGGWSRDGCERDAGYSDSNDVVTCHCNHLTSFSILLDVSPQVIQADSTPVKEILSVVTYMGCIVSILCLFFTIVTYLSSMKLRKSEHGQLLLNVCLALSGLYTLFLLAFYSTSVPAVCVLVSALMQYFFLVTFIAMAAEAINLYLKLVVVLGKRIHNYVLKAAIVSWVLPLFLVLFCLAPYSDDYANPYFCRPLGIPFYAGMIAPFLIIYTFNWAIFIVIMCSLVCKNCSKKEAQNHKQNRVSWQEIMIAVTLSVLFGLGWGVGLLATEELGMVPVIRDVSAVLFVTTSSFHGLAIFIMYAVKSKEAWNQWRSWFRIRQKKDSTGFICSTWGSANHRRTCSQAPRYTVTMLKTSVSLQASSECGKSRQSTPTTIKTCTTDTTGGRTNTYQSETTMENETNFS